MRHLKVGLILNPVAGIGGPVALKGSDGPQRQTAAIARGGRYRAQHRCEDFLNHLERAASGISAQIHWHTLAAPMGAQCLTDRSWPVNIVERPLVSPTQGQDTLLGARELANVGVDILVFVGGDGTARLICQGVGQQQPVLGVPAGVKMHSGVFAVSPRAAAQVLIQILQGEWVARVVREVRDFDAHAPQDEAFAVRTYGELSVPEAAGYMQQTKIGGKESEPLAVQDICAEVLEHLPAGKDIVVGPGSTCAAIKQALSMPVTLRGCDVRLADGALIEDATASMLEGLTSPYLIVSFTRAQGFLFGRGNQQLSIKFLRLLSWPDDVLIVSTLTKLDSLAQRPLLIDSGDSDLDDQFAGLVQVCSGYDAYMLYRLSV